MNTHSDLENYQRMKSNFKSNQHQM